MHAVNGEHNAELKAQFDEHGFVSLPGSSLRKSLPS
jgi:hypothetical protein